ncbi:serine hydrolase domain-containing protein [Saccharospirillum alexandrii]|uniref:serine hydrolase domain-containing protein n=1 Tax=Saccharospirillum alexandrii TaxID=2448477 RepID=UPI000FD81BF5|nr:serine hydrolase domain-containing protein [Saccharospirillum alexandrii]
MSHHNLAFAQDTRVTQESLSQLINEARNNYQVPAIALTVMNSDKILLQEIQGERVVDIDEPTTLDDYFHIGSCSKSVLAVIAEKIIEERKITWQTKFFDVYPELKIKTRNEYLNITLEHLFLCEAGIQAYTSGEEEFPEIEASLSNQRLEFIKYLIQQPPASKQKKDKFQHLYSNASYTMASAMLERVAGYNYENLVKITLNDDLGISVHIGWPNRFNRHQPWGHLITKKKVDVFPPEHEYKLPYLLTPAGDLSLTPRGYAKYTQLHLKGLSGENNYISSEGYKYIHFAHKGFSLGVANGSLGGKGFSAFDGSAGTFFCRSIIVPESDIGITIMMNAGSGSGTMKAVDWLTMQIVKNHFNWWWKFWL